MNDKMREEFEQTYLIPDGISWGSVAYVGPSSDLFNIALEAWTLSRKKADTEMVWCACGDGYPANSYAAGFMAANNGACENCDATSSQA